LLVLENEAMYQQFKVDRGSKDHWAMYPAPDKIPVFYEDEDGNRIDPKKAARPTPKQILETIVVRTNPDSNRPSTPMRDGNIASPSPIANETVTNSGLAAESIAYDPARRERRSNPRFYGLVTQPLFPRGFVDIDGLVSGRTTTQQNVILRQAPFPPAPGVEG